MGADLRLYANPVALAQKNGGHAGIRIKLAEPDPSVQAARAALSYADVNRDFGLALHEGGGLTEILKANGLDASGTDVGEPRPAKQTAGPARLSDTDDVGGVVPIRPKRPIGCCICSIAMASGAAFGVDPWTHPSAGSATVQTWPGRPDPGDAGAQAKPAVVNVSVTNSL